MIIKEINDRKRWDSFFNAVGSPSFHQSWAWGQLQKALGYQILRLGVYDKDKLIAIALTIKIRSKRGNFLFIPHGPLFNIPASKLSVSLQKNDIPFVTRALETITDYLKKCATDEGFSFIRVAPVLTDNLIHGEIFAGLGYHKSPIYIHAETMWAVDLADSEELLLQKMRKTTRYLIRKGIRDGINIRKIATSDAVNDFWKLYKETYTREQFTPFPKSYIKAESEAFDEDKRAVFFFGDIPSKFAQEGTSQTQAASLVLFTNSTGYYHQGASIHTQYPVAHVLQWYSMLESKRRGCRYYNFYGIYKPGRTPASWKGLSLFKQGFGGFEVDYLPTQDLVVSKAGYLISYTIDKYLAWRRGI